MLAAVILVDHISDTDQFHSLTDSGPRFAGLSVVAVLIVGLLASVFVRRPDALPVVVVAVLPVPGADRGGGHDDATCSCRCTS